MFRQMPTARGMSLVAPAAGTASVTVQASGHPQKGVVPKLRVEVLSPTNQETDLVHKREIYERLGVRSRTEAIVAARAHELA